MNLKRAQRASEGLSQARAEGEGYGSKTAWNVRAGASEFPHANPALDWGAAWLGSALCDLPTQAEPHSTSDVTASTTEAHPTPEVTTSTTTPSAETMVEIDPVAHDAASPPTSDPTPDMKPPHDAAPVQQVPLAKDDVPALTAATTAAETVVTPGADAPTVAQAVDPVPEAPAQAPSAAVPTAAEVEDGWLFFVGAVETVLEQLGCVDVARRARSLLEGDGAGPTDGATALLTTAAAWRSVLIGERQDFDGCGETTLDEWAARLLAELVPPGTPTNNLRRELRRQGVAAFGIVPTAAARARSAPVRATASATPATRDNTVAA